MFTFTNGQVVFVLMLLATLSFVILAARVKKEMRLFHYVTAMITLTAAVSYYAMATHSGTTFSKAGKDHYREIFYARYVDWSVTTPLLLLDLCLLAGTPGIDIIALIFADLGMILTGLFASLESHEAYSWGWYTMACVFYLYIVYVLVLNGRTSAAARGQKVSKLFDAVALFTLVLWTLYPVAWGLSEGSGILDVDQEIAFYAVLDVLAKGVFGLWLLTGHMNTPESAVPLEGFWLSGVSTGTNQNDLA
ncbi:Opsin-1 [Taphrina deformans PYCC 5710]|uniref:Opsin-1 n=1 Tax=Taphrina deformans (strain PYCC 5710 / ATCC 11124 / CBS 356.35 / IMI 108563 / JCM 9778 / NBRC 8474) TaxID=1097556 RepID=R4XB45_TAPDE|nr:Opsin-1 [Taphrina deformans PYCC 5710]|eukprot:CCG83048.1 Opsin-1 [Taphrina deformans PYCC 5710]